MASQLSSGDLVSNRYASALYDFAVESKVVDTVLKDLNLLSKNFRFTKSLKFLKFFEYTKMELKNHSFIN